MPPNDGNFRPNMRMPTALQQMGGVDPNRPSWTRGQVWPTVPRQSTNPQTVSVVRFYSTGVAVADVDNVLNTPCVRRIKVDLPVILLWGTGTCVTSDGSGLPTGYTGLDCFDVLLEMDSGENITLETRAASQVLGTASRPGFLGGGGWIIQPGSGLRVTMTPTLPGLASGVNTKIGVTFGCLEFRNGSSYRPSKETMRVE